jgi:hypothetical protein
MAQAGGIGDVGAGLFGDFFQTAIAGESGMSTLEDKALMVLFDKSWGIKVWGIGSYQGRSDDTRRTVPI